MKSVKVPVLVDYATVPRRYRSLLYKLQRGRWSRPELRWCSAITTSCRRSWPR